jgi:hypothetical protein
MKRLVSIFKQYKSLFVLALILSFTNASKLSVYTSNFLAYTTPTYYYFGSPLPRSVKQCLYKIYKDKEFVDNLRYLINKDMLQPLEPEAQSGRCFGNLLVFSEWDALVDDDGITLLAIHESWHAHQMRLLGKIRFMAVLLIQWAHADKYDNIQLEVEARNAENYFEMCLPLSTGAFSSELGKDDTYAAKRSIENSGS